MPASVKGGFIVINLMMVAVFNSDQDDCGPKTNAHITQAIAQRIPCSYRAAIVYPLSVIAS